MELLTELFDFLQTLLLMLGQLDSYCEGRKRLVRFVELLLTTTVEAA